MTTLNHCVTNALNSILDRRHAEITRCVKTKKSFYNFNQKLDMLAFSRESNLSDKCLIYTNIHKLCKKQQFNFAIHCIERKHQVNNSKINTDIQWSSP